jgi:copper transport protein
VRRMVAVVVTAVAVVALWPGAAFAHANLASSDPAEGAALDTAPAKVTLSFTEPPDPKLSSIEVLNAAGSQVQSGGARPVPGDQSSLQVALPGDLPDGVYTVSWSVISTTDGHPTRGAFAFGVGVDQASVSVSPGAHVATTPGPSPIAVAGKALLYAGLALLLAAGTLGLVVFGGDVPGGRTLLWGAAGAAVLGTALLAVGEASAAGASVGALLGSTTGVPLIRLGVATIVAAGCAAFAAARRGRVPLALLAAAAWAAMLMRAWGGHAGGSVFEVLLQWAHFTAIGVWTGGLVLLALRLRARRDAPAPIEEIRRFSSIAGWSLLVVVVTGSLRALNELGGFGQWRRLYDEAYGITLLGKVALAAALIALGAVNRYRRIPALERGERPATFATVLRAEVVLAAGLFILTGVLTSLPPQQPTAASRPAPANLVATGSDFATTMRVRLTITPGTVGPNTFRVDVTDYDTGRPLPLTAVSLRLETEGEASIGASNLDLAKDGGAWQATGSQLALSGPWRITVVAQGSGGATEIPLEVRPRLNETVTVARAPGQPDLYTIDLPGGAQFQAYLDPDTPGPSQLHFTAFDARGQELPLAHAAFSGQGPGSAPAALRATRFGPGHFVADVNLTAGRWIFDVRATTEAGDTLLASFSQTIGGGT